MFKTFKPDVNQRARLVNPSVTYVTPLGEWACSYLAGGMPRDLLKALTCCEEYRLLHLSNYHTFRPSYSHWWEPGAFESLLGVVDATNRVLIVAAHNHEGGIESSDWAVAVDLKGWTVQIIRKTDFMAACALHKVFENPSC